jgi:hypothetical protein
MLKVTEQVFLKETAPLQQPNRLLTTMLRS